MASCKTPLKKLAFSEQGGHRCSGLCVPQNVSALVLYNVSYTGISKDQVHTIQSPCHGKRNTTFSQELVDRFIPKTSCKLEMFHICHPVDLSWPLFWRECLAISKQAQCRVNAGYSKH